MKFIDYHTYLFMKSYMIHDNAGLILGWGPANERRRYFVKTALIGRAQA